MHTYSSQLKKYQFNLFFIEYKWFEKKRIFITNIKMLPKRRHSIQTVPPVKTSSNDEDPITEEEQIQIQQKTTRARRQSIAESIQLMTKSVSK